MLGILDLGVHLVDNIFGKVFAEPDDVGAEEGGLALRAVREVGGGDGWGTEEGWDDGGGGGVGEVGRYGEDGAERVGEVVFVVVVAGWGAAFEVHEAAMEEVDLGGRVVGAGR